MFPWPFTNTSFCFIFSSHFISYPWIMQKHFETSHTHTQTKQKQNKRNKNRFDSTSARNGCTRNKWIDVTWTANDANDSTFQVISSRTAVCNGGPGKSSINCKSIRSSNSNCTNLRYLHTITTATNHPNYKTTATLNYKHFHFQKRHSASSSGFYYFYFFFFCSGCRWEL